jgi:hypothetical protein
MDQLAPLLTNRKTWSAKENRMRVESKKTKEAMRRKTQSPGLETNHTNEIRQQQKGFHNKEEKSFPNGMTLRKT